MRFTSKYAAHIVWIIDEQVVWNADGQKRVTRPAVFADFGESSMFGEETRIAGLDGDPDWAPDIRSGIFDTDEAAVAHAWTAEEKAEVERRLLQLCPNNPKPDPSDRRIIGYGDVRLYEAPRVPLPWPKYEDADPAKIPAMAESLGLVSQALVYEQRREKPRKAVVEGLAALAEREQAAETLVAAE